eukprot:6212435-Pleurochrysis_carterae.AAC.2
MSFAPAVRRTVVHAVGRHAVACKEQCDSVGPGERPREQEQYDARGVDGRGSRRGSKVARRRHGGVCCQV